MYISYVLGENIFIKNFTEVLFMSEKNNNQNKNNNKNNSNNQKNNNK